MSVELRPGKSEDALEVAAVLLASRAAFLPYAPIAHTDDSVRWFVREVLLPTKDVTVAEENGKVIGVMAVEHAEGITWIDQLYLLPSHVGIGIGSRLMDRMLATAARPIRLWAFQRNHGARRFYERHGFTAIQFTDGAGNEEHCPDVLYERTD